MFKKLPKEVLLYLFSLVNLNRKLECLLVCKDWYDFVMFDVGVHQKSSFIKSPTRLEDAFALFKSKPTIGESVVDLKIHQNSFDSQFIISQPKVLSNLINLELIANRSSKVVQVLPSSTDTQYFKAWTKVESIKTATGIPLLDYMLTSTTFPSLTKITVHFPT